MKPPKEQLQQELEKKLAQLTKAELQVNTLKKKIRIIRKQLLYS